MWLFPCFCSCESKTHVQAQLCLHPSVVSTSAAPSLTSRSAASEYDPFDRDPLGGFPGRVQDGALAGGSAEP